jgi:hypothetical protein
MIDKMDNIDSIRHSLDLAKQKIDDLQVSFEQLFDIVEPREEPIPYTDDVENIVQQYRLELTSMYDEQCQLVQPYIQEQDRKRRTPLTIPEYDPLLFNKHSIPFQTIYHMCMKYILVPLQLDRTINKYNRMRQVLVHEKERVFERYDTELYTSLKNNLTQDHLTSVVAILMDSTVDMVESYIQHSIMNFMSKYCTDTSDIFHSCFTSLSYHDVFVQVNEYYTAYTMIRREEKYAHKLNHFTIKGQQVSVQPPIDMLIDIKERVHELADQLAQGTMREEEVEPDKDKVVTRLSDLYLRSQKSGLVHSKHPLFQLLRTSGPS